MTTETAQVTKLAAVFGQWVAKYKFFWKLVDHDKWMTDFKTAFPDKEYQEAFWTAYAEERPEFKERQEQEKAMKDYERTVGFKEE